MKKRLLAMLLVVCTLCSLLPVSVIAETNIPAIKDITFSVTNATAPVDVECIVQLDGDISNIKRVDVKLYNPEDSTSIENALRTYYYDDLGNKVSYSDGKFHGTFSFTEYHDSASYYISTVWIWDNSGECRTFTRRPRLENEEALPEVFLNTGFTVIGNNPDSEPPVLESFSLSSTYTEIGHTNINVTLDWCDDVAGLDYGSVIFQHTTTGEKLYVTVRGDDVVEATSGTAHGYVCALETDATGEYILHEISLVDRRSRYICYEREPEHGDSIPFPEDLMNIKIHVYEKGTTSATLAQPYTQYGETVRVTANTVGSDLTYQWYIKNAGSKNFSKSSVTSKTYSCKMDEKSQGRQIYCVITTANGETRTTDTVTLRMAATITADPKTGYAKMGDTVTATVKAEGDWISYQWYIKNAGAKKYSKSSVTSATYSVKMSDKVKGRRVYCVITDAYGNSVQTKTVLLREAVSIVTEPKTGYAKSGKTVKVSVEASGDELTYQWYIKNAGGSKYSKSSITSATYSAKMSDKVHGRRVYCVVTDKYGKTVQSKTVLLRMAATITTQPKNVTVAKGETAKVKVTAVGDELTYQWYIKNEGASKFSKSSVTKATYSVKMSDKVDGRQVYCVVTDKYGKTAKSNTVTLSMSVPAIYINKSGTKYHYDPDCAGKSAYEVTLSEAIAAGRTPCSKCVG